MQSSARNSVAIEAAFLRKKSVPILPKADVVLIKVGIFRRSSEGVTSVTVCGYGRMIPGHERGIAIVSRDLLRTALADTLHASQRDMVLRSCETAFDRPVM
jgi:hypothetical protein